MKELFKVIVLTTLIYNSILLSALYLEYTKEKPNIEAIELKKELEYVKSKKNTLMLIILEQRKKKPKKTNSPANLKGGSGEILDPKRFLIFEGLLYYSKERPGLI